MRKVLVGFSVALAMLVIVGAALGITNGRPDGSGHPEVGALLAQHAFSDGTWEECTGTLIAPKVFLTAEHCDEGVSRVAVTFDSHYDPASGTTYWGTWHGDPQYGNATGDPHDVAVVILDKAPKGITPARLPTLEQLTTLNGGDPIVAVGYGAQSVTQGQGKTLNYEDTRYVATGSFTTLTQVYL